MPHRSAGRRPGADHALATSKSGDTDLRNGRRCQACYLTKDPCWTTKVTADGT